MAHLNVIDVKSFKFVWKLLPAHFNFYSDDWGGTSTTSSIISPECFAPDDANLRWSLKVELSNSRKAGSVNWLVVLRAGYGSAQHEEFWGNTPHEDENQSAIAGEATFEMENLKSSSSRETTKCTFFKSEKTLKKVGSNNFIGCCKIAEGGNNRVLHNMTLTCKVSYLYLKDAVPILVSGRYVTVPIEKQAFVPAIESFEDLYLSKKHSDVTLCVNGTTYYAHKIILAAQSTVFNAMFEHDMEENKLNWVEIKDIDEIAFLQALRYIYTGKVENVDELVYGFLPVADRYDIKGLKMLCENVLRKQLSLETVVQTLMMADSYNVDSLKASAIQFLTSHSNDVVKKMNSEDWDAIMARPRLVKDLLCLFMSKNNF